MILSMTAFSRMQKQMGSYVLTWELRSINHRYLEVSFRLPESLRFLESVLRPLVRNEVHRGKLECQLKLVKNENADSLLINAKLVQALVANGEAIANQFHLANDLSVSQLLQVPGVIETTTPVDEELIAKPVEETFLLALQQLMLVRSKEGDTLKNQMMVRVVQITDYLPQIRALVANTDTQRKEKLLQKLKQLEFEAVESRLEQEIAYMLIRLDVSEEIDRIECHIREVARILECEKIAGRRLDFLMQELNREVNTLSSKSDSIELIQIAVEIKVLIEQMREQVQNIE